MFIHKEEKQKKNRHPQFLKEEISLISFIVFWLTVSNQSPVVSAHAPTSDASMILLD